jgi:hypothetical protein
MIDHGLLKPAGAAVLVGAAAAALTVGQSAFAVGGATATHMAPSACSASGLRLRAAPALLASHLAGCHPRMRRGTPGTGPRPLRYQDGR